MTTQNMSNWAVENAAITYVIKYEKQRGREAWDCRAEPGCPVDVVSRDPSGHERLIEVKAFGKSPRSSFLWLETSQVRAAEADPERFHLYVVENMRLGDPALIRLLDIHGESLAELLQGKKEKHYFEVPFKASFYDRFIMAPPEIGQPEQDTPPRELEEG